MLEIRMTSAPKGSNPGGCCQLGKSGKDMNAYIKYCSGSRLTPDHPFSAPHQPIYEALTLTLAEKLGLGVPRHFLLVNSAREIIFTYENAPSGIDRLSDMRPYYLLSELITMPEANDASEIERLMQKEKIYQDMLMVSDIFGRKQNYRIVAEPTPKHFIYIDLGCSFVDAHNGTITQNNRTAHLLRDKDGEPKHSLRKDLRYAREMLKRHWVETDHYKSDEKQIINLLEFCEGVRDINIPLFPHGYTPLRQILNADEIDEIVGMLQMNIAEIVRKGRKNDTLEVICEE